MQWYLCVLILLLGCGGVGCARNGLLQTPAASTPSWWEDGSYMGVNDVPTPQLIRVAVGISQGRIATVHLLQHPAWSTPAAQAELVRLVVESQTTAGHVPRGTGSEQDHLLQAIDDALTKARSGSPTTP